MKDVFSIVPLKEKPYWHKIGVAFANKDGSFTVKLHSLPLNGELQIRERIQAAHVANEER